MRILICDHDNRDIVSLVYHYNKLGHEPVVPAISTPGWEHETPLWTKVLFKSTASRRYIDDIFMDPSIDTLKDVSHFGEDSFITRQFVKNVSVNDEDVMLRMIDVSIEGRSIDAWHLTPNAKCKHVKYFDLARAYFPHAKFINSGLDHFNHNVDRSHKNIVRWLPANYSDVAKDRNSCDFYRHPFEFSYLGVDVNNTCPRVGYSSFNHNFSVRHPKQFEIFTAVNDRLIELNRHDIVAMNYGGNVRKWGADLSYSGSDGITGNFKTLSPRDAMMTYMSSRGVLHLKQYDWSGGVPAWCRIAGTPMIMTTDYALQTHSNALYIDRKNCLYGDTIDQIVEHMIELNDSEMLHRELSMNMKSLNDQIFSEKYWSSWRTFLNSLE